MYVPVENDAWPYCFSRLLINELCISTVITPNIEKACSQKCHVDKSLAADRTSKLNCFLCLYLSFVANRIVYPNSAYSAATKWRHMPEICVIVQFHCPISICIRALLQDIHGTAVTPRAASLFELIWDQRCGESDAAPAPQIVSTSYD